MCLVTDSLSPQGLLLRAPMRRQFDNRGGSVLVGVVAVPAQAIVVRDPRTIRSIDTGKQHALRKCRAVHGNDAQVGFSRLGHAAWRRNGCSPRPTSWTTPRRSPFNIGGQTYQVDRKIVYPSWNGDLWSGSDIGLVHLVKPVDNIKPAQIYTGSGELNQTDTVVGFGKTGTGDSGETKSDGLKRGAQNVISQIENKRLLVADFDKPLPAGAVPTGYAHA